MKRFTNVKMGGVALLLVLFVFASGSAWGQVGTLPINQSGGTANLPVGFSQNGLGSDYKAEPMLKFDTSGDYLVLQFESVPQDLTYTIKWNGTGTFGTFAVEESADGNTYTELETYTNDNNPGANKQKMETFRLLSTTRYIRWKYVTKVSGNVGLGEISVTELEQTNQVAVPDFSRAETTFTEPFTLTASCATEGATIHYTYGDEVPTATSPEFPAEGIEISKTTTVNAIAVMADGSLEPSGVISKTYTLELAFAWSAATCKADIVSTTNVYPTLTTNSEGAVSYSSSDETVATIDATTGNITLVGKGKTTITAAVEAWGDFSASTASYELTVINSTEVSVFRLINSESGLEAGANYLVVNITDGKALGEQKTSNRGTVDVNVADNFIAALNADVFALTLGGSKSGGWTFFDESKNGYLCATGTSSNQLKIQEIVDAKGKAQITFDGDDANIIFNNGDETGRNKLMYNNGDPSNLLFSCYLSVQQPVQLFKQVPGYIRNVVNGNYGTICLPYAVQASDISGAVFFSVDGKKMTDGKPSSVVMTEVESLEAGKPYIFQATADKIVLAYSGEEATVAGSDNGFIGSFEGKTFDGNPGGNLYLLVQNKIMAIGATAGGRIGTNRAYFDLDAMDEFTGPLNAKQRVFSFNGGVTGIESVTVDADALVDVYAVSGVRVRHAVRMDVATEGLPAGVYVVNGKKVVVK